MANQRRGAGLAVVARVCGAGDVTRTRDLLITNQLLYQLSYAGQAGPRASTVQRRETRDSNIAGSASRAADGVPAGVWQTGSTPVRDSEMGAAMSVIYIGVGGHVVAIREATGEEVWRTKLRRATFVTICVRPAAIYAGAAGHLYCLDPVGGAIRWHNGLDGLGTGLVAFGDTTSSAVAEAAARAAAAAAVAASSAG
jgi:hypothetical protein